MKIIFMSFVIIFMLMSIAEAKTSMLYGGTTNAQRRSALVQKYKADYEISKYKAGIARNRAKANNSHRKTYYRNKTYNKRILRTHRSGKRY